MRFLIHTIYLTLLVCCFSQCKKIVDVGLPTSQVTRDVVFRDSANATAATMGIYHRLAGNLFEYGMFNGGVTVFTGLSGDELIPGNAPVSQQVFYTNTVSSDNGDVYRLWQLSYELIYQCNAVIEGLKDHKVIAPPVRDRMIAEAKVVRAYSYFLLMNVFGDVPFVTDIDYLKYARQARMPVAEIYPVLIADVVASIDHLPPTVPNAQRVRLTRAAGNALLARFYLYTLQWAKAETTASLVLDGSSYRLQADLNKVYVTGSIEAIWQLRNIEAGYETSEGVFFIPAQANQIPNFYLTPALIESFEAGDLRLSHWMKIQTVSANSYTYPFKYKFLTDPNPDPAEGYTFLRLGEQYLIRAEARIRLGKLTGAGSAASDLDSIRLRAGLSPTSAASESELLLALEAERRHELFAETGHRWFDLKRWGLLVARLGSKPNFTVQDGLYPIPEKEITLNPSLLQNEGY